ncbi:hypothetical protein KC19_4G198600 [Ceratodon purpureus]|nr:hypothetical protein KC19_4G198600 [Ceratodon purpureus]KAG0580780.1 hypothetical protein KC19_4G198600 [Ceratodon purpureus]
MGTYARVPTAAGHVTMALWRGYDSMVLLLCSAKDKLLERPNASAAMPAEKADSLLRRRLPCLHNESCNSTTEPCRGGL